MILQDIINHYTKKVGLEVPPKEATLPPPPASLLEATKGLAALRSYLELQDECTIDDLKALRALDQKLALKAISERKQSSISAYFQPVRAGKDDRGVN